MNAPLRLLIFGDSGKDSRLIIEELDRAGFDLRHRIVSSAQEAAEVWDEEEWDAAVYSCRIRNFTVAEALDIMDGGNLDCPLLVVSEVFDAGEAAAFMELGARDYISLEELPRLPLALRRELHCFEARRQLDLTDGKVRARNLRAQRMESIGMLASGIAHDLNNVLAPILLSTEMLLMKPVDEESEFRLSAIRGCVRRGVDMVNQLLTFGRGAEGERILLQPRHVLQEVSKFVSNTFPKNIEIRMRLPDDLWCIRADSTQLHQSLLNLCLNARDSMPKGGTLTLETENIEVDENFAAMVEDASVGDYVVIKATDTGLGIAEELFDNIFEPFYTTKQLGEGTGLGLATLREIVKAHNGFVTVRSEVGRGSTFSLYWPAEKVAFDQPEQNVSPVVPDGNGELILLVDDEPEVLKVLRATLESHGYRVIEACEGADGLAAFAAHIGEISAVVTDLLMPGMDGQTLISAMRRMSSDVAIIVSTGYDQDLSMKTLRELRVNSFLFKPYSSERLLKTLQVVLETPKEAGMLSVSTH